MAIADILAKRAAEQNAAQQNVQSGMGTSANMFPTTTTKVLSPSELLAKATEPEVHIDPGTGQQFLGSPNNFVPPEAIWPEGTNGGMETPEDAEDVEIPEGAFLPIRLKRFVDQNGVWVTPKEDGFFWPANEYEQRELEHFEKQYAMVRSGPKKSAEETQ